MSHTINTVFGPLTTEHKIGCEFWFKPEFRSRNAVCSCPPPKRKPMPDPIKKDIARAADWLEEKGKALSMLESSLAASHVLTEDLVGVCVAIQGMFEEGLNEEALVTLVTKNCKRDSHGNATSEATVERVLESLRTVGQRYLTPAALERVKKKLADRGLSMPAEKPASAPSKPSKGRVRG